MPDRKTSLALSDTRKLKKIHLFSDLGEEELDSLKSISHLKNYSKEDIIFFDTEPYRGFYCVSKGKVRIYKVAKDGREHTLHFVGEQYTFAEVPMFENPEEQNTEELTYPANAIALEDGTQLIFIPKKAFFQKFSENPKIYLKMIVSLSKRLRLLNSHIEMLTLQDVSKRLANYILKEIQPTTTKDKEQPVDINITRAELASYLNIASETLSRMLGKFQDDGIITIKGRSIKINNLQSLVKLAKQ